MIRSQKIQGSSLQRHCFSRWENACLITILVLLSCLHAYVWAVSILHRPAVTKSIGEGENEANTAVAVVLTEVVPGMQVTFTVSVLRCYRLNASLDWLPYVSSTRHALLYPDATPHACCLPEPGLLSVRVLRACLSPDIPSCA